jgi:hypothetical protein
MVKHCALTRCSTNTSAYANFSIRQTWRPLLDTYVSIRQHTPAYASIRQHMSDLVLTSTPDPLIPWVGSRRILPLRARFREPLERVFLSRLQIAGGICTEFRPIGCFLLCFLEIFMLRADAIYSANLTGPPDPLIPWDDSQRNLPLRARFREPLERVFLSRLQIAGGICATLLGMFC